MRKILSIFLLLIFFMQLPAMAFSFKKKSHNPVEYSEKIEYVHVEFFEGFEDDYLIQYIYEAIQNNHDAKKASWTVEEYRQNIKSALSKEFPSLNVGSNYLGLHIPAQTEGQSHLNNNSFVLPFRLSYEADLLLKNFDKIKSTKKTYEASKYQEKTVYIVLASDVATAYINILQYDALISLQQRNVEINKEQLDRATKKFKQGVIDRTALNNVMQNYETSKNSLESLMKSRTTLLTQFAVLIGKSSDCIDEIKRSTLAEFDYKKAMPNTIDSDVIFARPDIMAAEANLEKGKIDIRVARKEFLPTFNIYGIWAFNSRFPGNFFGWNSTVAGLLAGATQDIFKGGYKLANLRINQARYEQMFEDYKQTGLQAVKEVNDALAIIKIDERIDTNTYKNMLLEGDKMKSATNKLSRGVISYPDYIAAEENYIFAAQNRTKTKAARIVNYITLYKAVGGKL